MHGTEHPYRSRPTSDAHHGKRRNLRRWGRMWKRIGNRHFNLGPPLSRCRGRLTSVSPGDGALANEKAAPVPNLRPRDQFVAGQPTPRGQFDLHGRVGGEYLQQAARLQRIDVPAYQQQQPAAAVKVAPVEAGVGFVDMLVDGVHWIRIDLGRYRRKPNT